MQIYSCSTSVCKDTNKFLFQIFLVTMIHSLIMNKSTWTWEDERLFTTYHAKKGQEPNTRKRYTFIFSDRSSKMTVTYLGSNITDLAILFWGSWYESNILFAFSSFVLANYLQSLKVTRPSFFVGGTILLWSSLVSPPLLLSQVSQAWSLHACWTRML